MQNGEPFRLLFPVGVLLGLYGVAMWPLHIWAGAAMYPGQFHARIMIQGFLSAFVIGFLGTALPRLLETPKVRLGESLAYALGLCGAAGLHASGRMPTGDLVFLITMGLFVGHLALRGAIFRKDVPPPGFVLVALGMACALAGTGLLLVAQEVPQALPDPLPVLGRLLLHQGYLLFPVMGIGAFLLPRFFGLPSRQSFPASTGLPPGWLGRAGFALFCGGVVLAGFVLEAFGEPRWGNGLRAGGVLFYFLREVPAHRAGFGGGALALGLRLALASIPIAYGLMAAWPERTSSFLHVLFISGFSLLTLIVASRVVLGHSGRSASFRAWLWPVLVMTGLVVLAMLTRVSADWMPQMRQSHYAYAAVAWMAGVAAWSVGILPGLARPDEEE
ncbi:MAG: NnrS family protein [Bacteroidales bacterium]|nr:NnrS family protein [Bacteroidales bacterium]